MTSKFDLPQLQPKHQQFLVEYLTNGFNATQAAIAVGYAQKNARTQSSLLLKRPDIAKHLEVRKQKIEVELDYSQTQWGKDVLRTIDEARANNQYNAAFKGYELLGKHIGAVHSGKRARSDAEEALHSYLANAMEADRVRRLGNTEATMLPQEQPVDVESRDVTDESLNDSTGHQSS